MGRTIMACIVSLLMAIAPCGASGFILGDDKVSFRALGVDVAPTNVLFDLSDGLPLEIPVEVWNQTKWNLDVVTMVWDLIPREDSLLIRHLKVVPAAFTLSPNERRKVGLKLISVPESGYVYGWVLFSAGTDWAEPVDGAFFGEIIVTGIEGTPNLALSVEPADDRVMEVVLRNEGTARCPLGVSVDAIEKEGEWDAYLPVRHLVLLPGETRTLPFAMPTAKSGIKRLRVREKTPQGEMVREVGL